MRHNHVRTWRSRVTAEAWGRASSNLPDIVYVVYDSRTAGITFTHGATNMGMTGELETLILMAVLRLGDDAYGVSIGDEIAARTGRRLTRGAIYSALRRLEAKGMIAGSLGEATAERGGRAKRFLALTPAGREALLTASRDFDRMRAGLDDLLADA